MCVFWELEKPGTYSIMNLLLFTFFLFIFFYYLLDSTLGTFGNIGALPNVWMVLVDEGLGYQKNSDVLDILLSTQIVGVILMNYKFLSVQFLNF